MLRQPAAKKTETSQPKQPARQPAQSAGQEPPSLQLMLQLQSTIGNQSVQKLLRSGALQARLKIGQPGDPYEQEADRMADQVMRMPEPMPIGLASYTIQRKCAECEEEENKKIQTKPATKVQAGAELDTEMAVNVAGRGGAPLSQELRSYFEPRFGFDFSGVRVHADGEAANGARAVRARAYTLGRDIVFGSGEYAPATSEGKRLLAHELTHVVQQSAAVALQNVSTLRRYESRGAEEETVFDTISSGAPVGVNHVTMGRGFLGDNETPMSEFEPGQIGIGQSDAGPVTEAGPTLEAAPSETTKEGGAVERPAAEEGVAQRASCAITSRTTVHAPDGTPDTRTTIGVNETIEFTLGGQVADWTSSSGWPGARKGQATFLWAAPEVAGTSTITATIPANGQTCIIDMTVVAPSSINMRRNTVLGGYAAGTAGAGMTAVVRVLPMNVNFGWVAIKEDPGPASNVTGYFATRQAAGANLNHVPTPNFVRLRWNNTQTDTAGTVPGVLPPPWAVGTWDWRIPTRYRCFNSTGSGYVFTTTLQQFRIDAAGGVTVSKQGASVSRNP